MTIHEFETTLGDEIDAHDLRDATWLVEQTFVDIDENGVVVLTHRVSLHLTDDQVIAEVDR